jgi:hypothetical protein
MSNIQILNIKSKHRSKYAMIPFLKGSKIRKSLILQIKVVIILRRQLFEDRGLPAG